MLLKQFLPLETVLLSVNLKVCLRLDGSLECHGGVVEVADTVVL